MGSESRTLITSVADLCDAFFHVKDTPEACITQHCLCMPNSCCSGKTTALIAQLVSADGREVYLHLYRNAAQTSCAEGFMQRDTALRAAVDAEQSDGMVLNLFLTQQPCHFSSSNDEGSCTENLLSWWSRDLFPRGVKRVAIKAAYPYRAHWDETHMGEEDLVRLGRRKWGNTRGKGGGKGRGKGDGKGWRGSAGKGGRGTGASERHEAIERARRMLASAREGTRKLVSSDEVTLEAFGEAEWQFVLGVCDQTLQRQYGESSEPFTPDAKAKRAALDQFTKATFDAYRQATPVPVQTSGSTSSSSPAPAVPVT